MSDEPELQVTLDDTTETYTGTFRGLECYSNPDEFGILFPHLQSPRATKGGWRTMQWAAPRARIFDGSLQQAFAFLWSINRQRVKETIK